MIQVVYTIVSPLPLKMGQHYIVQLELELFQDAHVQQKCELGDHLPNK